MKKVKYFIIFVCLLLVLTGCSERALTFDRVYPDTSSLEKAREKRQLELGIEKEVDNLVSAFKKEGKLPRSLTLSSLNDSTGYTADAGPHCWANKLEKCENLQPKYPDYNFVPYYTLYYLRVAANEQFSIGVDITGPTQVPFPARIEAYIYDENKNLHLHEAIENPGNTFKITAPSNLGSYVFQFKAYYEGEVEGISYHPHGITVIEVE